MHSGKAVELKEKQGWKGRLVFSVVGEEEVAGGSVLCFESMWVSGEKWEQSSCSVDEDTAGWCEAFLKKRKKTWKISHLFLLLFRDLWYLCRVRTKKVSLRRCFEREILFNQEACLVTLTVSTGGFRYKSVFGGFCLHTLSPFRSMSTTWKMVYFIPVQILQKICLCPGNSKDGMECGISCYPNICPSLNGVLGKCVGLSFDTFLPPLQNAVWGLSLIHLLYF